MCFFYQKCSRIVLNNRSVYVIGVPNRAAASQQQYIGSLLSLLDGPLFCSTSSCKCYALLRYFHTENVSAKVINVLTYVLCVTVAQTTDHHPRDSLTTQGSRHVETCNNTIIHGKIGWRCLVYSLGLWWFRCTCVIRPRKYECLCATGYVMDCVFTNCFKDLSKLMSGHSVFQKSWPMPPAPAHPPHTSPGQFWVQNMSTRN